VTSIRDNEAQVRGNLTLLGVTKMVTLDVKINKIGLNPINQKKTVGISASTLIKRSDFAINFGLPGVSDNVKIKIEVEGNLIISDENSSSPTLDTTYSTTPRIAQWKIIPAKSSLEFKADQENSSVKGSFKNFSGEIYFDKNQLSKSKISIEVDTSSVDTSFAEALDTLKSAAWLGVQGFPKATFTAEKFTAISASQAFRADGVLTIKEKSSPISIEFTLEEYSKTNARAVGKTTFKRSLFNIGDRDFRKANGVKDDIEINFTVSAER
jgi:polyisoprenoid-binding protein YceI